MNLPPPSWNDQTIQGIRILHLQTRTVLNRAEFNTAVIGYLHGFGTIGVQGRIDIINRLISECDRERAEMNHRVLELEQDESPGSEAIPLGAFFRNLIFQDTEAIECLIIIQEAHRQLDWYNNYIALTPEGYVTDIEAQANELAEILGMSSRLG